MNLVDSSGWLEYFADGSNADFYAPGIENIDKLIVPTSCILEVFKRVLQQSGEDAALQVAAIMHQGQVVALSSRIALKTAIIGTQVGLSLTDRVIPATAQTHGAFVWPQDVHFKDLQGVKIIEER